MKKKNSFFGKLLNGLKGFGRRFLITLKKNPQFIPLGMLLISFLIYSLNLTDVSDTTATLQGKGMGLCEFLTMLFSILSMIAVLNAFPKRKKPNYALVVLIVVISIVIIVADFIYVTKVSNTLFSGEYNKKYYDAYITTYNMLYIHMVLMAITAVTVVLEPLFAKLLKKIKIKIELEETNVANIDLAEEE